MRVFVLAMIAISISLALACGGEERLTVAEYAEFCAGGIASAASLIEPDRITWGELEELASQSAMELRAVKPPEELSEFHRASLKTVDLVAGVAADQESEERANPLAFGLEAIRVATQLGRSVEALSPQVRTSLREAGCV